MLLQHDIYLAYVQSTLTCFNTASGRCCCNVDNGEIVSLSGFVSIPQAVGAVATRDLESGMIKNVLGFNTASGRCCCNM